MRQYALQGQQYAAQLQNLLTLPQQIYAQVTQIISGMRGALNSFSLSSGTVGETIARLQSAAAEAAYSATIPSNMTVAFDSWQQSRATASQGLQKQIALSQQQAQTDAATLQQQIANSNSTTGALQALQAGNLIASTNATQLMEINTNLLAYLQTFQTTQAVAGEKEAVADQYFSKWISAPQLPMAGNQAY